MNWAPLERVKMISVARTRWENKNDKRWDRDQIIEVFVAYDKEFRF
jgi:hypothetical protein